MTTNSNTSAAYLRHPHIAGDLVAFVAEDDVWLAEIPAAGTSARAWRVTSDRVPVTRPRIAPDGGLLAWNSQRDGEAEAYVTPVEGGEVTRLTYLGGKTGVRQWRSADELVIVSDTRSVGRNGQQAYVLAADGGVPERLPYGRLQDLDVAGPDGAVLLRRGLASEAAYWKRYRGGTAGKLWLDRTGTGEFTRFLPEHEGNIGSPMWVGGRAAFLSDVDGVAEVYSVLPDGTDLRRHTTDPGEYFARQAATDGTRVVFARAGKLYLLDSLADGAEPRPLDIRLSGTRFGRSPYPVGTAANLRGVDVDRTGRASVVEVRGGIHWLTHRDGPARVLSAEPGVRNRLPVVLGETGDVAWVSDAGGEYAVEIAAVDGDVVRPGGAAVRRILAGELDRVYDMVASPDGTRLAISTETNKLLLVDVAAGTARVVVEGLHRGRALATGLAFSPDSRWLAWAQASASTDAGQIRLADVETLTVVDVTQPRFQDESPAFTVDGKHLVFLSSRTFDPFYAEYGFDLEFVPGVRPYLVPLAADEPSPFAPRLAGRPVGDEDKKKDKDKKDAGRITGAGAAGAAGAGEPVAEVAEAAESAGSAGSAGAEAGPERRNGKDGKDAPPETVVDVEGLASRVVPFPVRSGNYRRLRAVKGGVLWLELPVGGSVGDSLAGPDDEGDEPWLRRFDFAKRESTTIVDELSSFEVSGDGNRIVVLDGTSFRAQAADSRADDADRSAVDLDRIRVTVDPVAERRHGLTEAWRLQREFFWRDDMGGRDWPAVLAKYLPLVDAVATADDFVDLVWELHGELGTSHAYTMGIGRGTEAAKRQGLLGADLDRDADGAWRITRILPGDSSVPAARSPLAAPGVAARVGDVVAAVDGRPVDPRLGPAPLLAGKGDKPVALTLLRDGEEPRVAVVVPLTDESRLRYRDQVASRRAYVAERSGGRLGYLHLPDQGAVGWAEFHRDLAVALGHEGLVVDTRDNGGGNTSQLVSEKLLRKPVGWSLGRDLAPITYPQEAPRGPLVSVADENAGSDGDIINHVLKSHGVPVVGTRTWGGVVGIDGRFRLIDGTGVTQPRYAMYFDSVGYAIENHGVDPTIEVHMAPQDQAEGRDPQLDRAIDEALALLAERPAVVPPERPWSR